MLGVVNDLYSLFITQDFHNVQIITKVLRGDIFLLNQKKMKMNNFSSFNGCKIKGQI